MRSSQAELAQLVKIGDLEIRPHEGLAVADGHALILSVREFDLLVALASNAGRVVSREELYRLAWGGTLRPGDRSCDVYVHKLRAKLERAMPEHRFIHTHVGFGYRLDPGA
jgi:DNA-binding response OmpR family regulator